MKKIYILFTLLLSLSSFGQSSGQIDWSNLRNIDETGYRESIMDEKNREMIESNKKKSMYGELKNEDLDYLTSSFERDENERIRTSHCSRRINDGEKGFNLSKKRFSIDGRINTRVSVKGIDTITIDTDHGCAEGVTGVRSSLTSRFSLNPIKQEAKWQLRIPLYGGKTGRLSLFE